MDRYRFLSHHDLSHMSSGRGVGVLDGCQSKSEKTGAIHTPRSDIKNGIYLIRRNCQSFVKGQQMQTMLSFDVKNSRSYALSNRLFASILPFNCLVNQIFASL